MKNAPLTIDIMERKNRKNLFGKTPNPPKQRDVITSHENTLTQ